MGIPDDETLTAVVALGKAAGAAAKPPRKPVGGVLKVFSNLGALPVTPPNGQIYGIISLQ